MPTDFLKQLEEEQEKLKAQMSWESPQEPTATGVNAKALSSITDEDAQEATGLLNSFMKGRMMVTPPGETFNDYFDKNNPRPALTALQDGIRSMLAGRTGQKFVSVRDQSYEQYKDYITRQDKIRTMERLELNTKVQSAIQLLKMKDSASKAAARLGFDEKTFEEKLNFDKIVAVGKMVMDLAKLQLTTKKDEATIAKMEAERAKIEQEFSKDPKLNAIAQVLRNAGKNPADPEVWSSQFLPMISDLTKSMTREPRIVNALQRGVPIRWTDGFGNDRMALISNQGAVDMTPGKIGNTITEPTKDFKTRIPLLDGQEESVTGSEGSHTFLQQIFGMSNEEIENSFGFLTALKGNLPHDLSDTALSPAEKLVLSGTQSLTLARNRGKNGARASDMDLKFINMTLPSVASTPGNFVSLMASQSGLIGAAALRERLGVSPNDLDIVSVVEQYRRDLLQAFEEAKSNPTRLNKLKAQGPLTAEQIIAVAATKAGRQDIIQRMVENGRTP